MVCTASLLDAALRALPGATVLQQRPTAVTVSDGVVVVRAADPARRALLTGGAVVAASTVLHDTGAPVVPGTSMRSVGGVELSCWPHVETPRRRRQLAEELGSMAARLHAVDPRVVAGIPGAGGLDGVVAMCRARLAASPGSVRRSTAARMLDHAEAHLPAAVASAPVVCHGDLHGGNLVGSGATAALIDLELVCIAPRCWDLADIAMGEELGWYGVPALDVVVASYRERARLSLDGLEALVELRAAYCLTHAVAEATHDPGYRAPWLDGLWGWADDRCRRRR